MIFAGDLITNLDENKWNLISRTDEADPEDDEDEDGHYKDNDVDDHLGYLLLLAQLDGWDEVDEEGAHDGQSTAREEDGPKDLQHLSVVQVVVDVHTQMLEIFNLVNDLLQEPHVLDGTVGTWWLPGTILISGSIPLWSLDKYEKL